MTERELLGHLAANGTPPADGPAVSRLSVGLETSLKRFAHETLPFIASGGAELQFICGAYGRGKTHYLKALSHHAKERHFVTSYVDCQDNQVAFRCMRETYRAIANGMTPPKDLPFFFSNTGITKIIEAQFTGKDFKEQRALIDRVKADRALVADFRNLVRAYCNFVSGEGDEDLAEALEALLAATPSYRMPFRELYRQHRELPRPLGKLVPRNAAIWLRALLSLPRVLGYHGLLVCFDETETVLQRGNDLQRQHHLAHIRTFIDHLAAGAFRGCAVYYAVADDFEEMAAALGALTQRIERVQVPEMEGPNPRAVSVYLDELTVPEPNDHHFFETLAQRILDIGRDAGLPPSKADRLMSEFPPEDARETIYEGGVRQFVKMAAGKIMPHL